MRVLVSSAVLCLAFICQDRGRTARDVANAELAFARTSREANTVNAFLSYLADDAIMFRGGEPVDGLSLWRGRMPDSTLLNWWPILAGAAKSGDLGFTTGPYQFFASRTDKTPSDNGYYSTIWQKQADGKWKIKLDLGVSLGALKDLPTALNLLPLEGEDDYRGSDIRAVDFEYNKLLNAKSVSVDRSALAKTFRIHRPSLEPCVNSTCITEQSDAGMKFQFEYVGEGESLARDLAYTYGKVLKSASAESQKANYLRVWRVEDGSWKIILDVVTGG